VHELEPRTQLTLSHSSSSASTADAFGLVNIRLTGAAAHAWESDRHTRRVCCTKQRPRHACGQQHVPCVPGRLPTAQARAEAAPLRAVDEIRRCIGCCGLIVDDKYPCEPVLVGVCVCAGPRVSQLLPKRLPRQPGGPAVRGEAVSARDRRGVHLGEWVRPMAAGVCVCVCVCLYVCVRERNSVRSVY
jgi:hypothetical protein